MNKTKGIILAGGNGSRLYPLTYAISKQLLPVYDKPLIYYPLSLMLKCGIRDILIIVSKDIYIPQFQKALKDVNANISYQVQLEPLGLAHAFIMGEKFIGDSDVCLMLGDNLFYGSGISSITLCNRTSNNAIFGVQVSNPEAYGVMKFKQESHNYLEYSALEKVVEKPKEFVSNYAVPGVYFFDNSVMRRAKEVKPSARGELEIVDVINSYIADNKMYHEILSEDTVWFDCGTHDHLLAAGNFIQAIQQRTNQIVGDITI